MPTYVATLAEFKTQLDRADSGDDAELTLYLSAATSQIEWLVGPITVTAVTERYCVASNIALRMFPLVAVASVKPVTNGIAGTALATTLYTVDLYVNEIRLNSPSGRSEYEVAYTYGRATVPDDIKLAGLIIAQHLWTLQNARFAVNAPNEDRLAMAPGSGFTVPYRALELLRPYPSVPTVPGIA